MDNISLNMPQNEVAMEEMPDTLIQSKNLCSSKVILKINTSINMETAKWEKIFRNHVTDKRLLSKIN